MKRIMFLAIVAILLISAIAVSANAQVNVVLDGKKINFETSPAIVEGRTLLPIRSVVEAIGGDVQWDNGTKTVTINTCDVEISIVINSKNPIVNGEAKNLDVAAQIIGGRTMVPLRFVGEALGAEVGFDANTKTVTINYFSKMSGTLKIGGSTTVQPICQAAADNLMKLSPTVSISVAGGGSGAGVKGAMDGTFNIGGASRELSKQEYATYADIRDTIIGSDGIAVVLNTQNIVADLTKKQVYDIYTGAITNWKDVGGEDAPILIQTREAGSGTLTAFIELAVQPINKLGKIVATATPHTSNGLLRDAVAGNKNAIGFISFGFIDNSVQAVKIEGVSATKVNALTKKWPYVRPLNIVTKGSPSGLTAKFINYLTSPEGQEILKKEQYLPLRIED